MAALAASWIPEDDLLLKNSIEAGASLEALAKGAVRFSRKFTVRELQDRWRSLLYDPIISAEASARMLQVEQSASIASSNSHKNVNSQQNLQILSKRKVESIRRLYYALRKRNCTELRDSGGPGFLRSSYDDDCDGSGDGYQEPVGLQDEAPAGSYTLDGYVQNHFVFQHDNIKETPRMECFNKFPGKLPSLAVKEPGRHVNSEQNNLHEAPPNGDAGASSVEGMRKLSPASMDASASFNSMGYSSPHAGVPLWKTMEDVSAPVMPIDASTADRGEGAVYRTMHHGEMNGKKISSPEHDVVHSELLLKAGDISDYADLSEAMLNFPDENGNPFVDIHERDTLTKSCCDNENSYLLNSPNDVNEDHTPNAKELQTLVLDACPGRSNDTCPAELDVITDHQSHSVPSEQQVLSCSEVNIPLSTSATDSCYPEPHDKVIYCTLNSEDPEIPCNDDVFFCQGLPLSVKQTVEEADGYQGLNLMKADGNLGQSVTLPKKVEVDILPKTSIRVKSEFQGGQYHVTCGQTPDSQAEPRHFKSALAFPNFAADGAMKEEKAPACDVKDVPISSPLRSITEPKANPSTSDMGQYESDDNIPCFSDIEAMILEMDLCPDDSDSSFNREVSRYQTEDTKRSIIRLEQCARAAIHRAIASQAALAVLYGRHLKHYIKKAEVLLGRATEDVDVDIDLGREGSANKISRRQALIKLEGDGSFILKNLGKSSMFLNGKEVATGQQIVLNSNCLIEIKGMAFVFEINHKAVRQYLKKITQRNQGNNTNFEWSQEGVP